MTLERPLTEYPPRQIAAAIALAEASIAFDDATRTDAGVWAEAALDRLEVTRDEYRAARVGLVTPLCRLPDEATP